MQLGSSFIAHEVHCSDLHPATDQGVWAPQVGATLDNWMNRNAMPTEHTPTPLEALNTQRHAVRSHHTGVSVSQSFCLRHGIDHPVDRKWDVTGNL